MQGSPSGAKANMDFLDIKHVQLDTMAGHFLLPALLAFPLQATASTSTAADGEANSAATAVQAAGPKGEFRSDRRVLARICTFFSDHRKDAGETLFTAYTGGAYSKVQNGCAVCVRLGVRH